MAGAPRSRRGCGTAVVPHLIWTPAALADVQRLYRFLARNDTGAARRAAGTIRTGVRILASMPYAGRAVEDADAALREWLIGFGNSGYVALYRIDGDTVSILAIRHQKEASYD